MCCYTNLKHHVSIALPYTPILLSFIRHRISVRLNFVHYIRNYCQHCQLLPILTIAIWIWKIDATQAMDSPTLTDTQDIKTKSDFFFSKPEFLFSMQSISFQKRVSVFNAVQIHWVSISKNISKYHGTASHKTYIYIESSYLWNKKIRIEQEQSIKLTWG